MLLLGGLVADGVGAATVPADVLIDGQVIAAIGFRGTPVGCEVIDPASSMPTFMPKARCWRPGGSSARSPRG
jgi:hypothetical protein